MPVKTLEQFDAEIRAGRVSVLPFALGREDRETQLFDHIQIGGATIVPGFLADDATAFPGQVVDINAFMASFGNVDLYIKISDRRVLHATGQSAADGSFAGSFVGPAVGTRRPRWPRLWDCPAATSIAAPWS